MKNTLKRVCAVVLSFSFLSMHSTLAEVLTTGQFAGNNVLNNVNGGAVISGHTSGLSGVTTDGATARLDFNNNTRIDWSTLNVGSGQTLNFNNGNYAVLNNVLNGMSTFAGKVSGNVWGGNGTVIISNPNGMLLNGGQFETSGSIILTTKNLLGLGVNDLKDDSTINNAINNAGYNSGEYKIISIGKNGTTASTLTSNNNSINIISKGINIDGANLTANGSNGIALTTSDGQNFVASLNKNNGVAGNVNFGTNSIQIANASIKSNNGDLKLISTGGGDITATTNNTIVAPNITVNSAGSANLKNLTGYSSITANAVKNLNVSGTTTNTTNLTAGNDLTADGITSYASITAGAGHNLSLTNSKTNATSLTSSNDINASGLTSYSSINATSTNGNVNLSGVNSTNSTTLSAGNNVSIKGNLTSYSTVNATAGNIIDESDTTATITSNQMNLTAGNTVNLTKNYVDYCNVVANAKNIGVNVIGDYTYGSGFGSNTTLNATEGLSINATGNLTVNNQNIAYKTLNLSGSSVDVESSTLSGNLIINTAGNIIAKSNKINGYFDATSTNGTIEIRNNNGYINGDTTLLAKGGIDVISTLIKNGNLKATSTNDKVSVQSVTVNGDITTSSKNYTTFSNVQTNNLTANSDKNINMVYFNSPTSIICKGNVNLTAATNIQMDNTYTSGNLIATAAQNIITNGGSVNGTTSYNANNITSNGTVYNGNIGLNSIGNATISSSKDLNFTTPTVGGNLSATTSGNVNLTNGTITGSTSLSAANATSTGTNYTGTVGLNLAQDANFNSTSDLNFVTPKINGKLTAKTTTNINVTNGGSISGDTSLTAGKKTNVNVGSTDALSLSNLTVTNSTNHSDGNINVNNIASTGNVNIAGSSDVRSDIYVTNSTIGGNLTTTKGWGANVDKSTITGNLSMSGNTYNTSVSNSTIGKDVNLTNSGRKITLDTNTIGGNVDAETTDMAFIKNNTITGDLKAVGKGYAYILGGTANNVDLSGNNYVSVNWINANNVKATSTNGNANIQQVKATNVEINAEKGTATYSWSNISGDVKSTAKDITMIHSTINGNADLNATNDITINSDMNYNTITANAGDNISLARNGDYTFNNDGKIVLNAANQLNISATKSLTVNNGVFNALATNLSGTNVTVNSTAVTGDLIATTAGKLITNNGSVSGNTTYTANSITSNGTNYTGDVILSSTKDATFNSTSDLNFVTPTIGGKLTATTAGNINVKNGGSIVGDTTLTADKAVNVNAGSTNTLALGNLNIKTSPTNASKSDASINVNNITSNNVELASNGGIRSNITATNSTVNGNLKINNSYGTTIDNLTVNNGTTTNANADTYISNSTFTNGLNNTGKGKIDIRTTNVNGDETATTNSAIFFSGNNVTGDITANAGDWGIIQGVNSKTLTATATNSLSLNGVKTETATLTSTNSNTGIQNVTANNVNMTANNGTATYSWSTINGDTKTNAKNITMTNATIKGDSKLDASNDITVNDSVNFNTVTANAGNNISFARNGDYTFNNDGKTVLNAANQLSISATKNLTVNNGVFNALATNLSGSNVTVNSTAVTGDLIATTAGNLITNNGSVTGNATYTANNITSSDTLYNGLIQATTTNNANFSSLGDLNFANSKVNGILTATTDNNILVDNATTYSGLKATANNITLNRAGDFSLGAKEDMTASNNLNVNVANGGLTVDSKTLNGSNINLVADKINSNNSTYNGNTLMTATNTIGFNGTNNFNGTLNATSTNAGNIAINGDKTLVKDNLNITTSGNVNLNNVSVTGDNAKLAINNAYDINVNNTTTGKLSILNPNDSLFNTAQILNTNALTTEFANGKSLIIDLTASAIFGNNRNNIKNSASNVNELLIYPIETPAASGTQSELIEEATKTINTYKVSGINTVTAQGFTPIAFAANDKINTSLTKSIGNVIYRDSAGLVHITERLNLND